MTRALAGLGLLCAGLLAACAHMAPVLRVGTSGDYAPFSRAGAGFDVDVAERFAAAHGLRIRWVEFRWPELERALREERFDVAMSGITWRPERSLLGYMTRAVASGGPCLVGASAPERVAVNRGGVLERWARAALAGAEIVAVDDNLSLPARYRSGEVDAFVTDSFELAHVREPHWPARCEPALDRKVYWVAASRAAGLGHELDVWLEQSEPWLDGRRAHWFGASQPREPLDHLVDLLARRLSLMPAVAASKRARGLPLEDPEREARVLEATRTAARAAGLAEGDADALFRLQIELAKSLQRRGGDSAPVADLERTLRPAISALGSRIVPALARAAPVFEDQLTEGRLAPLDALLEPSERAALRAALLRVAGTPQVLPARAFRMPPANSGPERYSAWFGDSDGRVLYFGLSPFWEQWWAEPDAPTADLREPGDHLIGRFDLEREAFLPPLVARRAGPGVRGSVWDVLVHPSGQVFYTTFFEELGSVRTDGSGARHFDELGRGLNELALGPAGEVYVTRYARAPRSGERPEGGAIAVLSPGGELLRELPVDPAERGVPAPKSLAIDPTSGAIWLNTDSFAEDGSVTHETLQLAPDGSVLRRSAGPPELQFPFFDRAGTGWFAEAADGRLALRVLRAGAPDAELDLGVLSPADFVQEIRPTPSGGALLALWSGRVLAVEPAADGFRCADLRLELPPDCTPPAGRSALYTALARGDRLYATLFCGATVLRAERPKPRERCHRKLAGAQSG